MFSKVVNFVVVECFSFCVVAVGSFVLAHLGLMLVGQLDAFLSQERRRPIKGPGIDGDRESKEGLQIL
jgi:hypothetical protein